MLTNILDSAWQAGRTSCAVTHPLALEHIDAAIAYAAELCPNNFDTFTKLTPAYTNRLAEVSISRLQC
ncbi:MAG: hypothetical protein ACREBC_34545 [Pyrinomonadaceae bacterium]